MRGGCTLRCVIDNPRDPRFFDGHDGALSDRAREWNRLIYREAHPDWRDEQGPLHCFTCMLPMAVIERGIRVMPFPHADGHDVRSVAAGAGMSLCEQDGHYLSTLFYCPSDTRCAICDCALSPEGPFFCNGCMLPLGQIDRAKRWGPHRASHRPRITNVGGICEKRGNHMWLPVDAPMWSAYPDADRTRCVQCNILIH